MGKMEAYELEHLNLLRQSLSECMVLLKKNGEFPLSAPGKIAVFGSGVRHTVKGGTGSGEVNSRYFITVEQGLENAGFEITTKKWLDEYDVIAEKAKKEFVKEMKAKAKAAHVNAIAFAMGAVIPEPEYHIPIPVSCDTAIYVLSRISGEGNDRKAQKGDILLTDTEKRDILEINRKYSKFMLVLNVGGVVDLSDISEVENILILSQLGVETGAALADVLLGKTTPSGKLTTTWSAWEDYSKIGGFGDDDDTEYKEGVYVGYRYFDSVGKRALFPFGYGLTFTEFEYNTADVCVEGTNVTVSAILKNVGALSGKEVLQLYVSVPEGNLDQPYQILAGWEKTEELAPGEETQVKIQFNLKDISSYEESTASYILEKGKYVLRIGTSSRDTVVCGIVNMKESVTVRKVKNCLGTADFADYIPENRANLLVNETDGVTTFEVAPEMFETEVIDYDYEYKIDPVIEALTDEELVYMNIGAFNASGAMASVIGNASFSVAGAAGQTTLRCKEKGIPSVVMADGPAGVRVAKDYYEDEKGVHALGEIMPESMMMFVNAPIKLVLNLISKRKNKVKGEILHNYATAIPIGTAIAQSWNLDFAKMCGDLVGDEMERIGVNLWLAPALNIHRDIRCGRNFEYYSEDPLISGKMAAAITNGVQSHGGCGVTIKHFAANNQENNRYNNNSIVSERAMRDIYLKGFEICIRESNPKSIMTSYNLLNGIHTSERRDLNEDILRREFGFDGMVMTDWVVGDGLLSKSSKHHGAVPYKVVLSGNDVFMPGCQKDFDNVMEAFREGKVSRKTLQVNATRVYTLAKELCQG